MEKILSYLKAILKRFPIPFTKNQRYDQQTIKIIRRVCEENSNCIDVGCHKGEVLDVILSQSPKGKHSGFEPIPELFYNLQNKYAERENIKLYNIALASEKKKANFNYVTSNPSYSGLVKRDYDRPNEVDKNIIVQCDTLDSIIENQKVSLIKIDVEGGELGVLKGARETIVTHKPVVIFEHGLGASEFYGTTPEDLFDLLASYGMEISLLKHWILNKTPLSREEFKRQYYEQRNYYFIAHF